MGIDLAAMTWVLLWLNLFGFVRQLIIEHMGHFAYVDATRSDICGH